MGDMSTVRVHLQGTYMDVKTELLCSSDFAEELEQAMRDGELTVGLGGLERLEDYVQVVVSQVSGFEDLD